MEYFSFVAGICMSAIGLFGLAILLWRYGRHRTNRTGTQTAYFGQMSLSFALLALGVRTVMDYYAVGADRLQAILLLAALFWSVTALLVVRQIPSQLRNHH